MKLSASHSEVSLEEGKKKQLTETEAYEEDSGNEDGPRLGPKFDRKTENNEEKVTESQEENVSGTDSNDKETSTEMPVNLSVVSNKDENEEQPSEYGRAGEEEGQVLEIKFEE